jgi:hypothetical protein
MPPKLNKKRALFVLTKMTRSWRERKARRSGIPGSWSQEVFVRGTGVQYWRLENPKSFDES